MDPKGELVSYDKLGVFFLSLRKKKISSNKREKANDRTKKKKKEVERDRESFARKR